MLVETMRIEGIPTPVSRIGLGTWAIGGWMWGGADDSASIATLRGAVERGINLIDTAPVYGFGHSEEMVGQALAGMRDRAVIATKGGLEWAGEGVRRNSSPQRLRREVEDSLRRLRTDRIDLYQIHWPDPLVPIEDTARTLEALQREGKILAVGVSNYSPEQMDAFRAVLPLASVQPPYNLFERAIEHDVLPYAREHGLAVLAYGALCRGLLSGRMTVDTTFGADDLRASDPKFRRPRFDQYVRATKELEAMARIRYDKPVLALAIRWVLDSGPTIALWGARRPEQLDGVDEACGWHLSDADMADIDDLLQKNILDPVGPEFMAPRARE
ncbi:MULTISPECIES: aldo/keto reductase [Achromobacter]|uniref:Aldo/keto reductase n=1 Tax=Alcaligenes xylosoxydans xylosoxydans TaxID=85698 RepID=A0A109XVD2_ALCXX|nr:MULTISPECIES: aldo/keto reductase [Achromobacter]AMG35300.1 aldo/keto reductase [Achromobacter xylosoxidans]